MLCMDKSSLKKTETLVNTSCSELKAKLNLSLTSLYELV